MSVGGLPTRHPGHTTGPREHSEFPLYVYEPLESDQHIRLLQVSASTFNFYNEDDGFPTLSLDELHCELVQVPLSHCGLYQAVSYAWGDPAQDHFVRINGQYALPITRTLANTLPQLISICSTGFLWIDQICIDQSNKQERSLQVSIMGEIYSCALEVLIWTGGDIDWFPEMKKRLPHSDALDLHHIEALVQLFCRPWFSRGWTIQEAVLANVATVIVGSCLLSLEDLKRAWHRESNKYSGYQLRSCQVGVASFEVINSLRNDRSARFRDSGFDGLLNGLGDTRTSDVRDHVYAFLGLNQDRRIKITPDYNASACEVFINTTRAIIEGTKTLDCFRFLPFDRSGDLELPSWVPDWSKKHSRPPVRLHSVTGDLPPFKAAKEFRHNTELCPSLGGDVLWVLGRVIDTTELRLPGLCSFVDKTIYMRSNVRKSAPPRFFSLTDEQVTMIDDLGLTDRAQSLRERLLTVMVAGNCDPNSILHMYDNGLPKRGATEKFDSVTIHRMRKMWDYQMWLTQSGRLSLIPPIDCEKGDVIAIIHGCETPVLMRSREDGTYAVLGLCYLEDTMFGEAVTWEENEATFFQLS
ncbi:heterokaryon incompatibility protein-domain-containing protein [Pyrenochaeta sp. MPI-SDFR-AT-0127]|nr:heterokaryon incompatibility protein-domain-containing protein [Pyrenochaeta sp. MPI-SDFR-AT-0127]